MSARLRSMSRRVEPMPEHHTSEDTGLPTGNLARDDGLWTAGFLYAAVLVFLGLAAYLYWHGTGKLPWQ